MFSNMVSSLFQHGKIETTEPKAKELRAVAERAITWAKSVGDLAGKKSLSDADKLRVVHAKRMARRVVKQREALENLFSSIGPASAKRSGGYTRILKTRFRAGDAAPMALVQLVDWQPQAVEAAAPAPAAASEAPAEKKPRAKKAKTSADE